MAAVTTTLTVARTVLTIAYNVIKEKFPGGIWGFVLALFLVLMMFLMLILALLQAALSTLPIAVKCEAGGDGSSGGDIPAAGELIYPVAKGSPITSGYGHRWGKMHNGLDFGIPLNTPIYSIADGKVLYAGPSGTPSEGFGQSIWITHKIGGETWTSQYGHMANATKYVKTGDTIKVGQHIADSGNNGSSTGPHLHFQIQKGAVKVGGFTDPKKWLEDKKAVWASKPGKSSTILPSNYINMTTNPVVKPMVGFFSNMVRNVNVNNGNINIAVISKYSALNSSQKDNAKKIIQAGKEGKINSWGWTIALAVAMQESTMNNINGGDRDSLGLFQQRPSMGWGSKAEITNPLKSAAAFYGTAKHTNNPGLVDVKGWEKMPLTVAAQKVQRSGFPSAYAKWEPLAKDIVLQVADEVVAGAGDNSGSGVDCEDETNSAGDVPVGDCPAKASSGIENSMKVSGPGYSSAKPDTLVVARCVYGTFKNRGITSIGGPGQRPIPSDHTAGKAADVMIPDWKSDKGNQLGTDIATFVLKHKKELGVKYIIWDGHIWNNDRNDSATLPVKEWRKYRHALDPKGNDPTLTHRDHVHISVYGDKATGIKENDTSAGD